MSREKINYFIFILRQHFLRQSWRGWRCRNLFNKINDLDQSRQLRQKVELT